MENENKEEILNTTEEVTVEETAEDSEEKTEQYTENEKRQYARAKKAETENKELKARLKELETKTNTKVEEKDIKADPKPIDPLETVKLVNALKDLDDVEIEQAQMIADYKKISLPEAVKDEKFKLFVDAKREKDKKDNLSQKPNGKQGVVDKKDPFFEKFSQGLPERFDFTKK
jgi:hypothetical protein